MDISSIRPFLNVKENNSTKTESDKTGGFFSIFNKEISETKPVLNVKQFRLALEKSKEVKDQENDTAVLFGIIDSLNSTGLEKMSLNDEIKDAKGNSAVASKEETKDDSISGLNLNEMDSEALSYLLSYLFGNRTGNVLQEQSPAQNANNETGSLLMQFGNLFSKGADNQTIQNLLKGLNLSENSQLSLSPNNSIGQLFNELTLQLQKSGNGSETESMKIIQSLAEQIRLSINEGKDFTVINLEPSEFGKIIISLDSKGDPKNLQIAASGDEIKTLIEKNLGKLNEALVSNGIDVKDINIEKINLSKTNTGLTAELKTLLNKISNGEFNSQADEGTLSKEMKDLINLFVKNKDTNETGENSVLSFTDMMYSKINNSVNTEKTDIENNLPTQKVIDSLVEKISQSYSEGKTELEVKLVPENLGKLTVKIVSDEGKLSANIEVKNLEVKQAIDAGLVKLKDNLGQNGIHVEQINVSLSDDYYSQGHQERFFDRKQSEASGMELFTPDDIIETESMKTFGYNTLEYIV